MKKGDRVRMAKEYKERYGDHPSCEDHIKEFGDCEGVVQGLTDYNDVKPKKKGYSKAKIGPEFDVRWQPSNLRYAYAEADLELVKEA